MFEVALIFFFYVWNPCSWDPFGPEDCVDINPWVTCISILVLVDFCSKVNSCSLSFLLTARKPLDNSVGIFVVYVFYTVFSVLPLISLFELSHKHSNPISIFPWLKKDCPAIWGGSLLKHDIFYQLWSHDKDAVNTVWQFPLRCSCKQAGSQIKAATPLAFTLLSWAGYQVNEGSQAGVA